MKPRQFFTEPCLVNRADGRKGHYCIGRVRRDHQGDTSEFWSHGKWCSAGEVFIGKGPAGEALRGVLEQEAARIFTEAMWGEE